MRRGARQRGTVRFWDQPQHEANTVIVGLSFPKQGPTTVHPERTAQAVPNGEKPLVRWCFQSKLVRGHANNERGRKKGEMGYCSRMRGVGGRRGEVYQEVA